MLAASSTAEFDSMTASTQTELALIPHTYEGQVVRQRSGDGYVNATALCKAAERAFADYNRNATTKAFLNELAAEVGIPITELVQSLTGGNPALQGTWVHPQVAIHLAQWLSPKFAVRVTQWVYDWMSGLGRRVAGFPGANLVCLRQRPGWLFLRL
jgi:hypothetical protein